MRRLVVAQNSLGNLGVEALSDTFAGSLWLEHLDVSENGIDEDTAKTLAAWLAGNPRLNALSISGGGGELAHAGGGELRDEAFAVICRALAGNTHLRRLEVRFHGIRSTAGLAMGLKGNTTLRHIVLADNKIKSEGLEPLAEALPSMSLLSINLSRNPIGDQYAKQSFSPAGKTDPVFPSFFLFSLFVCLFVSL